MAQELSAPERQLICNRLITTVDLFADTCAELEQREIETSEVFDGWPPLIGEGQNEAAYLEATVGGEKFVVLAARVRA